MQKINQKRNIFPLFFYICPEPVAIKDQVMQDGTTIHQWQFHGSATSRWEFDLTGDGYYTIRSMHSNATNYYLAVENDSTANGASIVLKSGELTDGMKWKVDDSMFGGGYRLIPKVAETSGRVMAVESNSNQTALGLDMKSMTVSDDSKIGRWYFRNLDDTIEDDLLNWGLISSDDIVSTDDGFHMVLEPLSDILIQRGITETRYVDSNGEDVNLDANQYYDDWYFFSLTKTSSVRYGLIKMREDGSPGVTIPFISLDAIGLLEHLHSPTEEDFYQLYPILTKVTGPGKPAYDNIIQSYFVKVESKGAYLVAEEYTKLVAIANAGVITAPNEYLDILNELESVEESLNNPLITDSDIILSLLNRKAFLERIPLALEDINTRAGRQIFDPVAKKITVQNVNNLTLDEKHAILALHTANVSFNSFAAEVVFHADALEWSIWGCKTFYWTPPDPLEEFDIGEKAIRADMTIGEGTESGFFDDYYDTENEIVTAQIGVHGEY